MTDLCYYYQCYQIPILQYPTTRRRIENDSMFFQWRLTMLIFASRVFAALCIKMTNLPKLRPCSRKTVCK